MCPMLKNPGSVRQIEPTVVFSVLNNPSIHPTGQESSMKSHSSQGRKKVSELSKAVGTYWNECWCASAKLKIKYYAPESRYPQIYGPRRPQEGLKPRY